MVSARNVVKKEGEIINIDYFHPYESIPTSHTGIGFKIMTCSNRSMPHVILNCSVAKILQGHNVYGNTDMFSGVCQLLGVFCDAYQTLIGYLDFQNAYLAKFDITLPTQTASRKTAETIRDYLRNADWGRFRNLSVCNKKDHYNTAYFGSEGSRVGGFKVYCKGVELDKVICELTASAKKGNIKAISDLSCYTDEVIAFADKSVRIEATVKKRQLKEANLPTNLWQFMIYQLHNPTIYQDLFTHKTADFMQSLQGMRMPYDDDVKVYDLLIKRLTDFTKTGNTSTTKAKNAYMFYLSLKQQGFYEVKKICNKRTFQRNVKLLCDAGFNRAYLQNLGVSRQTPILKLLNIDLNAKLPSSYIPPMPDPKYISLFNNYLIAA